MNFLASRHASLVPRKATSRYRTASTDRKNHCAEPGHAPRSSGPWPTALTAFLLKTLAIGSLAPADATVPAGAYRFLATFERGAAATGGETVFHVADRAEMPSIQTHISLWGHDEELADWLAANNISASVPQTPPSAREVILACGTLPDDPRAACTSLAQRVARGSTVIFLSPGVLAHGNQPPLPICP